MPLRSARYKILNGYSLQCSGAGCNATDDNGNLRKQEVFIPANDQVSSYTSWYQQYDYDSLNRLKRVHEYTGSPALDWQQEYLYDQWGNRRIDVANTYGTGINNKNFDKEDATNRLYAPGDLALADNLRQIRYDITGNQIKDTYTRKSLMVYREIAQRVIDNDKDKSGVQAKRIKLIEEALKKIE